MNLPVLTFSGLLEQMAAGLQGSASQLIDLTVGSVLRAILQANASVILWLQWLILQVLATTRAATSAGPDLDSWMADFSFTRLPGSASSGEVTFSRYTPGVAATVFVGTKVSTSDGSLTFTVSKDVGNANWNGSGGYTLPALQAAISVPAECTQIGTLGNVQAGTFGIVQSPISGVDSVTNVAGFAGGASAEDDADFRARFLLFINSRSLATVTAIRAAVAAVQTGLRSTVIENVDARMDPRPGCFLVVVDDGTGNPPATLLMNAQEAVNGVRPIGSIFAVQGPAIVTASVTMTLETSNSMTHAAIAAGVQQAVATWIQGLPLAGTLSISKLDALAHMFDASVVSVVNTLINGTASDLVAPVNGVIIPESISVS